MGFNFTPASFCVFRENYSRTDFLNELIPFGDATFTPVKEIEIPLSNNHLLQGKLDFFVLGLILISLNRLLNTIRRVSGEACRISWDRFDMTALMSSFDMLCA